MYKAKKKMPRKTQKAVISIGTLSMLLAGGGVVSSLSTRISIRSPSDPLVPLQQLPAAWTESWPTWLVESDAKFSLIPQDETTGHVNPISYDSLYLPLDLKAPKCRPCLGIHVRDGTIRHILPAVDTALESTKDHIIYRNRGMCSVPRAHTWMEFTLAEDLSQYSLYLERRRKNDGDEEEQNWELLQSSSKHAVSKAMKQAIHSLAESPPSELGEGSHILHVVLDDQEDWFDDGNDWTTGQELRVSLVNNMDDPENQPSGLLEVLLMATMAGSESEYLPEAYQPLFNDPSLRRKSYKEFQERHKERSKGTGSSA
jgi:hypothetical protein